MQSLMPVYCKKSLQESLLCNFTISDRLIWSILSVWKELLTENLLKSSQLI